MARKRNICGLCGFPVFERQLDASVLIPFGPDGAPRMLHGRCSRGETLGGPLRLDVRRVRQGVRCSAFGAVATLWRGAAADVLPGQRVTPAVYLGLGAEGSTMFGLSGVVETGDRKVALGLRLDAWRRGKRGVVAAGWRWAPEQPAAETPTWTWLGWFVHASVREVQP